MVRLSLVNMYLHGFSDPNIVEYDTLTNEERWNDTYDIILANPPFMTPKGGIKPHKQFSIPARRSEVLFVDYIAEHLNPGGRAGVIVPEGIIFKSQIAYNNLRKLLVENYLWAVVSLPAGVFNPYSGVKTSILLMDKILAKRTKDILFVKIQNDGFDLGAQRRPNGKNDLVQSINYLQKYQWALSNGETLENTSFATIVDKLNITKSGHWDLSCDRYRKNYDLGGSSFDLVELGDILEIARGGSPRPIQDFITEDNDGINWIKIGDVAEGDKYITKTKQKIIPDGINKTRLVKEGDFILSNSMSFGRPYIVKIKGAIHDGWLLLRIKDNKKIFQDYLYYILGSDVVKKQYEQLATGGVVRNLNRDLVKGVKIPLPPLEIQKAIVKEILEYQSDIEDCRKKIVKIEQKLKNKISKIWGE